MPAIPETMRAVVYRGPNDLRVEMVPVPRIRAGELLVQVSVCGVCPTDIKKIQYGTVAPPRIFGHETAGTIVQIGKGIRGFQVGDRVALHHHVPCLDCHFCRHGAFAQCEQYKKTGITAGFEPAGGGFSEYVRVMPFVLPGVVKIPERNSFEEGAMLEPVNTVLKAVKRLSLLSGDTVLVAGQGPIGLMFTRILYLQGIKVLVTDLLESRLKLARKIGARWAVTPSQLEEIRSSKLNRVDAAILTVPSDAVVTQAMNLIRGGGQVLLFAHTKRAPAIEPSSFNTQLPFDLASVCVDEKDLIGSYSADFILQREVAELVFSRRLDVRKLITHWFPIERTAEAVGLAAQASEGALKIVITPNMHGR